MNITTATQTKQPSINDIYMSLKQEAATDNRVEFITNEDSPDSLIVNVDKRCAGVIIKENGVFGYYVKYPEMDGTNKYARNAYLLARTLDSIKEQVEEVYQLDDIY